MIPVQFLHDAEQQRALRAAEGVNLDAEHERVWALRVLSAVLLLVLLAILFSG